VYYVKTKSPLMSVKGRLALTASEVLDFIEQARRAGLEVDVTDADDNPVTVDQLRKDVRPGRA
jgi:hypothetical protein